MACTPITKAVLPPLPALSKASAPSKRSCSERVDQPLAICGHTKPLTRPRLQNLTSDARHSRSSLLSGVKGVSPIGNKPENCLAPVAWAAGKKASEAAKAPADCRKARLSMRGSAGLTVIDAVPLPSYFRCKLGWDVKRR